MLHLIPNGDTFTIFYDKEYVPVELIDEVIEVESLPDDDGILRRGDSGEFYFEKVELDPIPTEPIESPLSVIEEIHLEQLYHTIILETTFL